MDWPRLFVSLFPMLSLAIIFLWWFLEQMIEKRRRDRINNSLNELRRLVPAAFEKQGSAKLEKAEILQMTVDHLTMLHAKGKCQTSSLFHDENTDKKHELCTKRKLQKGLTNQLDCWWYILHKRRASFILQLVYTKRANSTLLFCQEEEETTRQVMNLTPSFFSVSQTRKDDMRVSITHVDEQVMQTSVVSENVLFSHPHWVMVVKSGSQEW